MLSMLLKMSAISILYVVLTVLLWYKTYKKGLSPAGRVTIGILYGICSILSTHYAVDYGDMLLNLRDVAPLAAGLFFHPVSGLIAGFMGGIERYIVGTYFGIGSYTRIACSISTCLAGVVALLMNTKVFKGRMPSPAYAFFMGAVMEVFHMYVVFITHRGDMKMAFRVVSTCCVPMIIFTGLALAVMSIILQVKSGEWKNPFENFSGENVSVSQTFQRALFIVTAFVIIGNFGFSFILQTESAYQNGCYTISEEAGDIQERFAYGLKQVLNDSSEYFEIIEPNGVIIAGRHKGAHVAQNKLDVIKANVDGDFFSWMIFEEESLNKVESIGSKHILLTYIPNSELYWYRNAQAYETGLADILLFTVIYVLIAFLVHRLVVSNINLINESLDKITNGDLDEVVTVRSSSEFASLSDGINHTVAALKGYIDAAKKKLEQELILAKTIQDSALPKNFVFPPFSDVFDIYAAMRPAREVGGDFYDFFFAGENKLALVIADVSGKGIPAALFMMRSKTAIRSMIESGKSPDDIIYRANNILCEGNDAEMFVTVWVGIIDLTTGVMSCANAGHEYPLIKRRDGKFEVYKDRHSLALAAMENLKGREYELVLEPGDKLFVYTDGIPEAINESVEQYGTERLTDAINSVKDKPFKEIIPEVFRSVGDFKGRAEQFDDITMIGFELKSLI